MARQRPRSRSVGPRPVPDRDGDDSWRTFEGTFENLLGVANVSGIALWFTDVTKQVVAEHRNCTPAPAPSHACVQSSPDFVLVIDTAGYIKFADPATDSTFGHSPDEFVRLVDLRLIHPEGTSGALDALSTRSSTSSPR